MLRKLFFALTAVALAAAPAAAQTTCTASSSWVNNPTLPTSLDESNHCNFAIFSWQSFLAMTEVADSYTGQLLFETYMDTDGLFPASGQSPTPWGSEPWPLTLGEVVKQAGSGNDLVAQSGVEVQYDESVNETLYDYVTSNMLYNANCFNAGGNNIHVPPTQNVTTDQESIELKTAWLPMANCNPNQYHCITALVNDQPTKVGLIGIHIVHKLPDHQEWIWSSFEHVNNAPDCAKITSPPSGYSSWNFFKTGFVPAGQACNACASEDGSGCNAATQCNTFVSETNAPNICRYTPLTTVACNTSNTNLNDDTNDVACLNASVQSILGSNSVWSNYMLVGTIWFKPGMTAPDSSGQTPPAGQQFIGNLTLSNSVMETYTQQANQNCFGCHTNTFKAFNPSSAENSGHADFSHLFNRIQATNTVTCPTLSQVSHGKKKAAAAEPAAAPVKPVRSHESYGQNKNR